MTARTLPGIVVTEGGPPFVLKYLISMCNGLSVCPAHPGVAASMATGAKPVSVSSVPEPGHGRRLVEQERASEVVSRWRISLGWRLLHRRHCRLN
jgi:hypothetical protein